MKPKFELEQSIQKKILVAIGNEPDFRCIVLKTGALKDEYGRLIRYGIVGGSDICGALAPSGRLICLETKTYRPGSKQSGDQKAFEKIVKMLGCVYEVVRSPEEALAVLARARLEEKQRRTLTSPDPIL